MTIEEKSEVPLESKEIRLHIGGLPGKISAKELEDRFKSFGQVKGVEVVPHQFEENTSRGFAFVDMVMNDSQMTKCVNILNGSSWRGGKLQITAAKPDFKKKRAMKDANGNADGADFKKRKLTRLASNQELVTEANVDDRKGWRRGRYGRPVMALLNVRGPNGKVAAIDSTHYKNNAEKLFGTVKPNPLHQLTWSCGVEQDEVEENESETSETAESESEMSEIASSSGSDVEEHLVDDSMTPEDLEMESEEISVAKVCGVNAAATEDEVFGLKNKLETNAALKDETLSINVVNQAESRLEAQEPEEAKESASDQFKVNVSWNNLFAPTANSFSLNLPGLARPAKTSVIMERNTSIPSVEAASTHTTTTATAHVPTVTAATPMAEVDVKKQPKNFASIFSDLNRVAPSGRSLIFGTSEGRREQVFDAWREERQLLKTDFKEKLLKARNKAKRKMGGHFRNSTSSTNQEAEDDRDSMEKGDAEN